MTLRVKDMNFQEVWIQLYKGNINVVNLSWHIRHVNLIEIILLLKHILLFFVGVNIQTLDLSHNNYNPFITVKLASITQKHTDLMLTKHKHQEMVHTLSGRYNGTWGIWSTNGTHLGALVLSRTSFLGIFSFGSREFQAGIDQNNEKKK